MPVTIEDYLDRGLPAVKGFLADGSAGFIAGLSAIQRELGQEGAVGEIGVHQGKLLLVLLLSKQDGEKAFAIDLFEDDAINAAQNSPRSVEILQGHLSRWAPQVSNLKIIKNNSMAVDPAEVVQSCGKARLLSIDGGHDEITVGSDLVWSEKVMAPYGVIIADDYFNESWPGVSAGIARYLLSPTSLYKPFAISPGKLYLTQPENAAKLQQRLRARFSGKFVRSEPMFGHPVDVFRIPTPLMRRGKAYLKREIGRRIGRWRTRLP
jgi:hypothetical protein